MRAWVSVTSGAIVASLRSIRKTIGFPKNKTAAIGKEFGFSPMGIDLPVPALPSFDRSYVAEFKARLAENDLADLDRTRRERLEGLSRLTLARHGPVRHVGRVKNCRRSVTPDAMSPPTKLPLCRSRSPGFMTLRARMQWRNPGAKRSICASRRGSMSNVEPFGTWQ